MLCITNLQKCVATKAGPLFLLRRINLEIKPGDFVTIMGPSGAGKSTLLSILGLYDHAWEGDFHFLGQAIHKLSPKGRAEINKKHIGFVFQQFHLIEDLTVAENLEVPLNYRGMKKSEREAIVADTLDRFGFAAKKDLFPSQLSGGQQQLVSIARAIIAKPDLLLADEPTGSLHSEQGAEIMTLFKRLNNQGTTIIQVSHSPEVAAISQRIIRLRDGWME